MKGAAPRLRTTLRATRRLRARAEREPLALFAWLPVQLRYFRSKHRRRLFRAGNQSVGKSTAGLADLIWDAEGRHPYRPCSPLPPGQDHREFWLICPSWDASVAAQRKLYALISKDRLHPNTVFTAGGFRGKHPYVQILHEDGSYSVIRIKTTRQGTLQLSADTLCGALFDEVPATPEVYSEVCQRTEATGGWVSICATMVGAPVDWLRALAEQPPFEDGSTALDDIHTRLTPDALIPVGSRRPLRLADGTVCDAAYIRRKEELCPPHEREVRVHGGWEIRYTERIFDRFVSDPASPGTHVHRHIPKGPRVRPVLGIDHGSKPGRQVAYLILVDESRTVPSVYILDEYVDQTGTAIPRDDAEGILKMLKRNGLRWEQLQSARGDIDHVPGKLRHKSNKKLQVELAKLVGIPWNALRPPVHGAKEGDYSGMVSIGETWLYHRMVRPNEFGVHPRCKRLIEALNRYQGGRREEWKDPIDAVRYGLHDYITDRRRASQVQHVPVYVV